MAVFIQKDELFVRLDQEYGDELKKSRTLTNLL